MKLVKLKDLGEIITGNTPPKNKPEYYGNYIPFVKATDINVNCKYVYHTDEYYSKTAYEKYKNTLIPKNSSCVVTIGTVGKKMIMANTDLFVNQAINAVIPNDDYDCEYVYYLLKYNLPQLNAIESGTSSGRENISKSSFSNIQVFAEQNHFLQEKIGYILSRYDEIIENNNKRIKILEQMAENLYKEWFVRFRFPGYENAEFENRIPKGWKNIKLREIAYECGIPEKKDNRDSYNNYVTIDCLSSKSMILNKIDDIKNAESSLLSFNKNDILFGAMRPYFHKVIMAPFKGLTRSTCFVISPKIENYRYFLYLLLFQNSTVNFATTMCVGSTMPYVRWSDFSRLTLILPNDETIYLFNEKIIPIIDEINNLYFSSQNLIKQRDLLLPRLMSGKLEVE